MTSSIIQTLLNSSSDLSQSSISSTVSIFTNIILPIAVNSIVTIVDCYIFCAFVARNLQSGGKRKKKNTQTKKRT